MKITVSGIINTFCSLNSGVLDFKQILDSTVFQWNSKKQINGIDGAYDLIICFRQINEIPKRISGMIHGYYHQNIHRLTKIQIIRLLGRKQFIIEIKFKKTHVEII